MGGAGDLAFSAMHSLRSIDTWIAVLNSNMGATGKVGHRSAKVKFGGSGVTNQVAPVSPYLGFHVAEQSIGVAHTTLSFEQGEVVASNEPTHFAVLENPDLFFIVDQRIDALTPITGTPDGTDQQDYDSQLVTRDGEFHWVQENTLGTDYYYLRDSQGNYVVAANSWIPNGNVASQLVRVTDPSQLGNSAATSPGLFQITQHQFLEYNPSSGTHFKVPPFNTVIANGNLPIDGLATGEIGAYALEASNGSLTGDVNQLALAQKIYSAVMKMMGVFLGTVDESLNLIR